MHGNTKINNWQIPKRNTHNHTITLFLQEFNQMRVQNPVKHLRRSFLRKLINGYKLLTIFIKSSILDVRLGSEYPSVYNSLDNIGNS